MPDGHRERHGEASRLLGANVDTRDSKDFDTDDFIQHDISFRYDLTEKASFRGGVNNVLDAEPNIQTGLTDNFDLFGRRWFAGMTLRY